MNRTILFTANFSDVFSFFERFIPALKELNIYPIFMTNKYSVYKKCSENGVEVYPILKTGKKHTGDFPVYLEKYTGTINESEARKLYQSTMNTLDKIQAVHAPEYIFMWSGIRLIERAAAAFAKVNSQKALFLELGNFPGKIFSDPEGTNAGSLLARKTAVLRQFQSDNAAFQAWRESYIENSLKKHSVPQSAGAGSIDFRKNLFDLYGFGLKRFAKFEPLLSPGKLKNKWLKKHAEFKFDNVDIEREKYIFYPMQVSDDAQILINSSTDNTSALRYCAKHAESAGLKLLVKPHPAERNVGFIKEFQQLQNELGFYFVNGNTIELISKAEKVITINSTVGLQAKLLGKPTECLGKAFFADFTEKDIAAYFQSYLVNADFWGDAPLEVESVKKFIERAELGSENVSA